MTARTTPAARLARTLPALCALSVLLVAAPASAHAELERTAPAADAVVDTGTAQVVLAFTAPVREALTTVVITGPGGQTGGPPDVRDTVVVQPLPTPLAAGSWTVAYRVVAEDGHPVTGTFAFTVAPATGSATSPTAQAAPPAPSEESVDEDAGIPVAAAVAPVALVAAAGGLALRRTRGRRRA